MEGVTSPKKENRQEREVAGWMPGGWYWMMETGLVSSCMGQLMKYVHPFFLIHTHGLDGL